MKALALPNAGLALLLCAGCAGPEYAEPIYFYANNPYVHAKHLRLEQALVDERNNEARQAERRAVMRRLRESRTNYLPPVPEQTIKKTTKP